MPTISLDVLANILTAIIIGIAGWLLSTILRLPFIYRRRRKLFEFFGVTKDRPQIRVYLSTVFVIRGGSIDFRGTPRTFAGPAVPAAELSTIEPISQLFIDSSLDALPSAFRKWLGDKVHWSFRPITPVFSSSPNNRKEVAQGNIITIGSQYYNSAGEVYTETCNPILKMIPNGQGMIIRVEKGPRTGDVFQPRQGQVDDLAIVERLRDNPTRSNVFIAAGLGVIGTMGAVHFIVNNWAKLANDFGIEPFAICLRFQDVSKDPNAVMKPVELSRFGKDL